ncbi:XRE family transcriptional regulator [Pseudomonas sichuanensis]|uniref:helix-turn-helix domain-containing protein n=1 Tax=Pseudomonas sichuanensis TaxID=2213015 RepID=UPI00244D485F|nr:XRE family transcriptional regulator [Pseudomonas sichuanensis]MDH0731044.1 XRE family transcriptional regulator [Pseudomonas sichuanensis]MDH1585780.1 XRE family transcriptional regulator [Pseudomonas sichuanensis]MDH1595580.1 XRE family transcriptional regulator [Pseudomonas sichuanensis]MDH1598453.1 XRE family transcriptional regulator [Pseudomonas sichuanensis]
MTNERSTSVWDALFDSPEEAENLRLRAKLMRVLTKLVQAWDLPQKDAARQLHLTQPRLSDLLNGKIDKFSLDALVNILANADLEVDFTVRKKSA